MNVKQIYHLQICRFANLQIKALRNFVEAILRHKLAKATKTFSAVINRSFTVVRCLSFVFCLLSLYSCFSVKYSMSGASISPDIKTLSIAFFVDRSNSGQSTICQQFTDNLRDKCRRQTSLKIITEGGDVSFECEITGFSTSPTAIQSNDQAAKNRLTITVHAKYTNSSDPKLSYDTSFSRFQDYAGSKLIDDVASELIPKIIDDLTEDIFNKAFVNW